ncbi:hypothetical protein R1flu_001148 [Riccia fluitans]|uniref:Uncharacterized protein n=1 Tax=Riccia fluitans TaxID=41844 RepID=A0ABD1Y2N3_9MARC
MDPSTRYPRSAVAQSDELQMEMCLLAISSVAGIAPSRVKSGMEIREDSPWNLSPAHCERALDLNPTFRIR